MGAKKDMKQGMMKGLKKAGSFEKFHLLPAVRFRRYPGNDSRSDFKGKEYGVAAGMAAEGSPFKIH